MSKKIFIESTGIHFQNSNSNLFLFSNNDRLYIKSDTDSGKIIYGTGINYDNINGLTGSTGSFQSLFLNSKNINLGSQAGIYNTSKNSINIGYLAGPTGSTDSIVLNASGKELHSTGPTGGFYVNPIASYSCSTGPFFLLGYGADHQIVQMTGSVLSNMGIGGGGTGTFYDTGSFDNVTGGSASFKTVTGDTGSFKSVTGGTGSFQSLSLNGSDLTNILTGLFIQPYAPTITSIVNGANDCFIHFNYPIQYQSSFISQPLPLITTANVSIKEKENNDSSYISIYTKNISDTSYTNYIATSLTTSSVVKTIHLRNLGDFNNGLNELNGNIYKYNWTSKKESMLKIWYYNYSLATPNFIEAVFQYMTQGKPSNVTLSIVDLSTYNANVSFNPPTYVDSTLEKGISPSDPINYLITYTPFSNSVRYDSVFNQLLKSSSSDSSSTTSQLIEITDLFPDTQYTLNMKLTNKNNTDTDTNSITTQSINFTTTYFEPVYTTADTISNSSIALSFDNKYIARKVSNNSEVDIINGNITGTVTYNIHNSIYKRGNNGGSDVVLVKNINTRLYKNNNDVTPNGDSINFNVSGWGSTNNYPISVGVISIFVEKKDAYSIYDNNGIETKTAKSGYYQTCDFKPFILFENFTNTYQQTGEFEYNIQINGIYPANNTKEYVPNTMVMTSDLLISKRSPSFYYDGAYTTPSIGSVNVTNNNSSFSKLCGLTVYKELLKIKVTTNSVKNIGTYFYNSTQILKYSSSVNTDILITETDLTKATGFDSTSGIDNNTGLNFNRDIEFTPNSSYSYFKSLTITSAAYNIPGNNGTNSSNLSLIYDKSEIITVILTIDNSTVLSNTKGCRLKSYALGTEGTGINILNNISNSGSSFSLYIYDHNDLLTSNYELLYANDRYTTHSDYLIDYNNTLGNTLNYSNLSANGLPVDSITYRYATFGWKIDNSGFPASGYNKVIFKLTILDTTATLSKSTNFELLLTNYRPLLYYRIEDSVNIDNFNGARSTPWIAGNTNTGTKISSSNFTSTNTNYKGFGEANDIIITGNIATFNLIIPNKIDNSNSNNNYIYCRIGIPQELSVSFSDITCSLSNF
jgi:hypothetical protein